MAIKKKVPCPRCDGKGVIPQYFYNRKGICFLCWGSKYIYVKVPEGMTEEAYLEKLRKDEIEHLKNHPPKVPMPDADKHRNKEYFKGANTKIEPKPVDNDGDQAGKDGGTPSKVEKVTFDENSEDFKNLLTRNLEQLNRTKKNIEENLKNTELKIEKWNRDKKDGMAGSGTDKVIADLEFEKNRLLQRQANVDEAIRRVELAELRKKLETKSVGVLRHEISTAEEYIKRGRPKFRPADYTEEMNKKGLAKAKETIAIANEIIKKIEAERPKVDRNTIIREPLELSKLGQEYTVLKRGERVKIYHSGSPENAVYHEGVITAVSNATGKIKVKRDGIDEDSAWHDSWIDVRAVKEKLSQPDEKPSTTGDDNESSLEQAAKYLNAISELIVQVDDDEERTSMHYDVIRKKLEEVNIPDDDSDESIRLRRQKRSLLRHIKTSKEQILLSERLKGVKEAINIKALQKAIKEFNREGFEVYTDEDLDRMLNYNVDQRIKTFMDSDMQAAGVSKAVHGFMSDTTSKELEDFRKKMQDKYGNVPEAKKSLDDLMTKIDRAITRTQLDEKRAEEERQRKERMERAEKERKRKEEEKQKVLDNISFKDTELGRKIKEIVDKSELSTERTAKIGKVVAEALESRTAELYGDGYAEADAKFKKVAEVTRNVAEYKKQYEEAHKKSYDKRVKPEKRTEWAQKASKLQSLYHNEKETLVKLRREMVEYHGKLNRVKEKAYLSVLNDIREMGGELNLPSLTASKQGEFIKDKYKNDISNLYPKEWLKAVELTGFSTKHYNGRSFVQGRTINVDGRENDYARQRSTFIHELQHAMDDANPKLNRMTKELYVSLTNKSKLEKLYAGTSENYRPKNDGSPWLNNYMGKIYSYYGNSPENSVAWEINTMAMECLITGRHEVNGVRLQDVDPEVYYHLLGVLASV